jgi:hypothetical protein
MPMHEIATAAPAWAAYAGFSCRSGFVINNRRDFWNPPADAARHISSVTS